MAPPTRVGTPDAPGAGTIRRHPVTGSLCLLALITAVQTGHNLEHIVQVVQVHLLHVPFTDAHGVISPLDNERVHFVWNTGILAGVLALLDSYRSNRWLRAVMWVAAWHVVEHSYLLVTAADGGPVSPGLLADGGLISGGLPISRPDLHLIYNLAETMPLLAAFFVEWRRVIRRGDIHGAPTEYDSRNHPAASSSTSSRQHNRTYVGNPIVGAVDALVRARVRQHNDG